MLLKNIIILLCCCVYSVISVSDFIDKGQRAEIFELLDNEVATVKVSIPDDQFIDLKDRATNIYYIYFNVILPKMSKILKRYTTELQKINFNKVFPGYNFTDNLPQLQIGDDGYAKYDINQVVSEFDYNPEHYDEGNYEKFYKHFLGSNKNFNLIEIIDTLKGIEIANTDNKNEITSLFNINEFIEESPEYKQIKSSEEMYEILSAYKTIIKYYLKLIKNMNFDELFPENNVNETYPELQIGEDGYPKFNIDEVIAGFNFDPEYYEENNLNILNFENINLIYDTNKDFRLTEIINQINKLFETFSLGNEEMETIMNKVTMMNSKDGFDGILTEFKTKNATMTFELNGSIKSFKKVTFSLSGQYSREFPKPNYNIKIRGDKDLYGRSQFKLRSDSIEPTQLRTKLVSDIHNHLGLKSSSANYIQLYINEEYMGLYIITDLIKPSWVEKVYGDKDTSNLYKCKNMNELLPNYYKGCINENEDITDNTEWINFLKAVQNAKSASDLEDIFEIDHFLYEMAIEYLTVGWDHIRNGHNYNLYKQPNGKWIYLSYDFDLDIGQFDEKSYELSYEKFFYKSHIIDILILQDPNRFEEILNDVVNRVFNPSTLFPHIDELKKFIKPYVELDKIANSDGKYPGSINEKKENFFSLEQWDAYSEFTTGYSDRVAYGLKYWILMMYRNVCNDFKMECDPIYMDEDYQYPINKNVEHIIDNGKSNNYSTFDTETEIATEDPTEFYTYTEDITEIPTEDPTEASIEISTELLNEIPTEIPTEIPIETSIETSTEAPTENVTSSFIEYETSYDIGEPTVSTDDESSDEEDKIIDIDVTTIGIDDDESSNDEEEDTTEFVESSIFLSTNVVNTSTIKRTTITKTKTKTISYKTIYN